MARLDDIKAKARAGLAAAQRGIASGARSTALGARRLGRRASAMSSAERRAFCARAAPERTDEDVLASVNRAVKLAADANAKPFERIADATTALRVGAGLRMTLGKDPKAKLARLAGEAAVRVGQAMTLSSAYRSAPSPTAWASIEKAWHEAGEYADDAIDLASSLSGRP